MTQENAPEDGPSIDKTFGFDKFGFEKAIIKSIRNEGFETPTPIQDMAIIPVMSGADLMGIAQTGSGKTAAFSLPTINKLIHNYQKPESHHPKVLILAPTRELVMQIGKFIDQFSRGTPIRSLVVAGGQSYQPQIRRLKQGIDILISTPGRLIDHMGSKNVILDQCSTFILDEADRMLDMGFIDEVKEVRKSLTDDHQTVMFSATMNDKVRRLSRELLRNPEYVEQERKTVVAETITHKLMNVRRKNKTDLLVSLLKSEPIDKMLVFARTKLGADKLCDELKRAFEDTNIRIDAIHGDKKQRTREKILLNFRKGRTKVLVATDVAARGIDVDGISHVINYELPIEAENYVHRVGRTGRAGESGIAISFCDPSDMRLLKEIEALLKIKVEVDEDHKYHFEQSGIIDQKKRKTRSRRPSREKFDKSRGRRANTDSKRTNTESKPRREKQAPVRKRKNDQKETSKRPQKNFDPLNSNFGFDDDPVLSKLRGKTTKRKKKTESRDQPSGEKPRDVKQSTKTPNEKKRKTPKSRLTIKGKPKQTGGHKAFSPKQKPRRQQRSK